MKYLMLISLLICFNVYSQKIDDISIFPTKVENNVVFRTINRFIDIGFGLESSTMVVPHLSTSINVNIIPTNKFNLLLNGRYSVFWYQEQKTLQAAIEYIPKGKRFSETENRSCYGYQIGFGNKYYSLNKIDNTVVHHNYENRLEFGINRYSNGYLRSGFYIAHAFNYSNNIGTSNSFIYYTNLCIGTHIYLF